jgi:hypothetical protein
LVGSVGDSRDLVFGERADAYKVAEVQPGVLKKARTA